jgi:hypothetical protein
MNRPVKIFLITVSIIGLSLWSGIHFYKVINRNSILNAARVSFGGMKDHDRLALTELESNFSSPNDFFILSGYGRDMDFNSDYNEGDSLTTYYYYSLDGSPDSLLAIVFTYKSTSKTICISCNAKYQAEFNSIFNQAFEINLTKTKNALDSITDN